MKSRIENDLWITLINEADIYFLAELGLRCINETRKSDKLMILLKGRFKGSLTFSLLLRGEKQNDPEEVTKNKESAPFEIKSSFFILPTLSRRKRLIGSILFEKQ